MAYCTRDNIDARFGKGNVDKWADMDNDKDAAKITARINEAIVYAEAQVNDRLRGGPYAVPLATTHETIKDLASRIAGIWLYDNRGVTEHDEATGREGHPLGWHQKMVHKTIRGLRGGTMRLSATESVGFPQVLVDE